MPTLGLPTPMFVIFVATVIAGSLGAIHYVIVHVVMGRPFAEIPPPVVVDGADHATDATRDETAEGSDEEASPDEAGARGDGVAGEPVDPEDPRG